VVQAAQHKEGSQMKHLLFLCLTLACSPFAMAQSNLLYNGNLELTQTQFIFDGMDTTNQFALPGWEVFANGDANSWVSVFHEPANWRLDLSGSDAEQLDFMGLAGIKTAVSNHVSVVPGQRYYATVTYDNEEPAGASYFIDWFNAGGNNFSSVGGALDDPNGPLVFAPFTQRIVLLATAPGNAVRAGVRFQVSNPDFVTATADNFTFGLQPFLSISKAGANVVLSWTNAPSFTLQQQSNLSQSNVWINLGSQNPQTNAITSSNAFYRLVGP
jgi:hypothetical protein